jgi:Immunoglobulin domain
MSMLSAAMAATAGAQVNVTVDVTSAVRKVDGRVFGVNTACWDWSFDTAATGPLLAGASIGVLRYPGGGTSDVYFWTTNQVWNTNSSNVPITGSYSTMGTDFDQFASVALAQNSQAFITVNYGTSTPQDAANWVAYSYSRGYGFKYWEVGNENYGTWETDINSPQHDPVEYANRFVQYYHQMKAEDPAIEVGAVAPTSTEGPYDFPSEGVTDPVTGKTVTDWTSIMLSTMHSQGVMPDFLICHRYEQNAGQENDATLLQLASSASTGWQADAALLRGPLNDFYGPLQAASVELCVTENNSVHNDPGKQTVSLVNGLYLADSLGSLLQTEFNSRVWWAFRNGPNMNSNGTVAGNNSPSLYGWLDFGDYGIVATNPSPAPPGYPPINMPFPTFYSMNLLSHFAAAGDTVVSASSNNTLLSAYAVKRTDGTLSILAINKSPTATYSTAFQLAGFIPQPGATLYSYGIPQDTAAEDGNASGAGVATSTISNASINFTVSLAPYSETVVSLTSTTTAPAAVSQPSSQTIASGSTVVFSFAADGGPPPTYQWLLNGSPLSDGAGISGSASSTLVIAGATAADGGSYTCEATNSSGTVTSSPASLAVVSTANPGRLVNLSCRAQVGTGADIMTAGFVVGGSGVSGTQSVLVRGSGPALGIFGLSGLLPDPKLTLNNTSENPSEVAATDTGWGGNAAIASEAATLGAFSWGTSATPDSALLEALPPDNYTAQIAGASGDTGLALVEVYDATPAGSYTVTTPRLVNLSALIQVGSGSQAVAAGFVVGGATAKTMLIRASGPALAAAPFGFSGTLSDPQLTLTNTSVSPNQTITVNTGWGGNAGINSVAGSVGAFQWSLTSADSAILITLPPGNYTAGVAGASGDTGLALIELYEVQ